MPMHPSDAAARCLCCLPASSCLNLLSRRCGRKSTESRSSHHTLDTTVTIILEELEMSGIRDRHGRSHRKVREKYVLPLEIQIGNLLRWFY